MSWTLAELWQGFTSVLFPPACAACPAYGTEPLCPACSESVELAERFEIEGAEAARALWRYGGPAARAIQRLKYEGRPELGRTLGQALAPLVAELAPLDCVVPVPLSRRRLIERGYNQSVELARALPLPLRARALVRANDGRKQVGLDRAARLENLRGALRAGPQPVRGRSVLLIDDVVTTGATATAAVAALRGAGALRVAVLAVARA